MYFSYLILFFFVLVSSQLLQATAAPKRDEVIEKLSKKIAEAQVKKTSQLDFPFSFYKQKGVYPSHIHLAFFGGPEEMTLRRQFKLFDNNAFVTLWITSVLLEVANFGGSRPSDTQLTSAIDAISSYHDKNRNNSILVFWTQSYNDSMDKWYCGPLNLDEVVKDGKKDEKYIAEFLKIIGLEKYWEKIEPFIDSLLLAADAFYIPADFDDTYLNLGLGSLLKTHSSSSQYNSWASSNTDISTAMDALKKYAYRPFSADFNSRSIDPRTYFYIRDFLAEVRPLEGSEDLSLVSTWVENINETIINFYKLYRMPFGVNNVDLTVCANVLYGITSAVLSNLGTPQDWFDKEVQQIYLNTTSLVLYEIAHNFSSRPDLALTYYPSLFNFYWFTSRTLYLLNTYTSEGKELPFPVLQEVKDRLTATLCSDATNDILSRAAVEEEYVYFDDFLGDNDTNIFGKPVNHGDDRICSTSMALNTLFYIWNKGDNTLSPDTPTTVKDTLSKGCAWLTEYAVSDKYQTMNAFFSGSIKIAPDDFPLIYPFNFIQRANGSSVPPDTHYLNDVLVAVKGIIPETQYSEMLKETRFGYTVPIDFHGYNGKKSAFPFWSSDSFTHATSLLALTQCDVFNF